MDATGSAAREAPPPEANELVRIVWVDLAGAAAGLWRAFLAHPFAVSLVDDARAAPAEIDARHPDLLCVEIDAPVSPCVPTLASLAGRAAGLPLLAICRAEPTAVEAAALRRHADAVLVASCSVALRQRLIGMLRAMRSPATAADPARARTAAAIDLVASRFPVAVSVAAAAACCHLSVSQFSRLFHREQGQSFKQFVVGYRIDRACEQMRRAATPLKQVGFDAGFSDLAYFSRAFRRRMGVSPSGYRAGRHPDARPAAAGSSKDSADSS
jgi:AraC-like DNA-binding protein